MSSPQPQKQPSAATQSVRKAQQSPTNANIVEAIVQMHEELSGKTDVASLKTDVASLKTDVASLKTDMATLKTDVGKLLHHFGLTSGSTP